MRLRREVVVDCYVRFTFSAMSLTVDRNPEFNYITDGYHPAARVPVVTSNAPRGLSELGGPAPAC